MSYGSRVKGPPADDLTDMPQPDSDAAGHPVTETGTHTLPITDIPNHDLGGSQ